MNQPITEPPYLAAKPHTETKAAPITGLFIGILFTALIGPIAAIFIGPFALVVVPIGLGLGLASRSGLCPNCGTKNVIPAGTGKCPACKHRLKIANKRLYDVT